MSLLHALLLAGQFGLFSRRERRHAQFARASAFFVCVPTITIHASCRIIAFVVAVVYGLSAARRKENEREKRMVRVRTFQRNWTNGRTVGLNMPETYQAPTGEGGGCVSYFRSDPSNEKD